MLDILRKVFDFSDWEVNHPGSPAPGDMLDASFDAQDQKINEILTLVSSVIRSDGTLAPNSVSLDALPAKIVDRIVQDALQSIGPALLAATSAAAAAEGARIVAIAAQNAVSGASDEVRAAVDEILNAKTGVLSQIATASATAQAMLAQITEKEASVRAYDEDWKDAESEAIVWAQASHDWAEYMPDTIPKNSVVVMDVTGDHWSSRWWANKATNAFGMLTALYLGAHPDEPFTNLNGGPIEVGAIYYNTVTQQPYVWDGSTWRPFWTPSRAVTASLVYKFATGTSVDLKTPDINGNSYIIDGANPEPLDVYVNGVKLVEDRGGALADFSVDNATSVVTFARGLRPEDVAAIDVLVPPENMTPVAADCVMLVDISPGFNGTLATFDLSKPGPVNVTPARPEQLLVSLDGVVQQPGWSYSVSGHTITFNPAPNADVKCWIVYFGTPGA